VHQKKQLEEEKLIKYADSTTTQIVVTIETLKGEDIGILTPKWGQGNRWNEKKTTGVLIWLRRKENMDSPGYGLEDRLTAGIGGEITRNIIIPFKAGGYYSGLDKGTDSYLTCLAASTKEKEKATVKYPIFYLFSSSLLYYS
jgi:uncharacterized protein